MSVRLMISGRAFWGLVPRTLFAFLLLTGCSARLQYATPGPKDVCLRLSLMEDTRERFGCGYLAVRQVSQYYRPELSDGTFRTDSLLFDEANDTVSVLHCLKANNEFPLTMKNGRVDGLIRSISSGDPVVVFVPGDSFAIRWLNIFGPSFLHCIVVVGHNATETELFFYSDGKGPYVISRKVFAHQWARVHNLCIMRGRQCDGNVRGGFLAPNGTDR